MQLDVKLARAEGLASDIPVSYAVEATGALQIGALPMCVFTGKVDSAGGAAFALYMPEFELLPNVLPGLKLPQTMGEFNMTAAGRYDCSLDGNC